MTLQEVGGDANSCQLKTLRQEELKSSMHCLQRFTTSVLLEELWKTEVGGDNKGVCCSEVQDLPVNCQDCVLS